MNITNRAILANGHHALQSLRTHAEQVAERGLATSSAATTAAGRASHRSAEALHRGSKKLSRIARNHASARTKGLALIPLINGVARLARRHPTLILAAGITAVAAGYAVWRQQSKANAAESEMNNISQTAD